MSRLLVGRYFLPVEQITEITDSFWGSPDDYDDPLEVLVYVRMGPFSAPLWVRTSELARALFPTTEEPTDVRSPAA